MSADPRPLVLHVMHRFDTGGLENGIVNLINHMPPDAYRHAVLALTDITDFRQRVDCPDVGFIALDKAPGHGVWQYAKLYRLFRELRPQIVHSRNLAALEVQVPAWAAGVPVRLHGEHGHDARDLGGHRQSYQRVRRFYRPFVHHYLALSQELAHYLVDKVHVPRPAITLARNGVDTRRFRPASGGPLPIDGCPFDPACHWLVGTVGRMQAVKDPLMLAHAFVLAHAQAPELSHRMRLVMVGDGPLREAVAAVLAQAGLAHLAWLAGERREVAPVLRGLHAFALPSRSEGISNAILEAMASGLPVVATAVGGNAELVLPGVTGCLTPPQDPQAMAEQLITLASNPFLAERLGQAGRQRVLKHFSLGAMVATYQQVYTQQLQRHGAHLQRH